MNFVEMTSAEWDEVYRQHDALVQRGELELQAEEIRETPRAGAVPGKPVELALQDLSGMVVDIQH